MSNVQTSDLQPIQRLIARTRQLLRLSWVIIGMAVTGGLLLGILLVVALADLTLTLWPSLRWVALALVVVPVGWAFVMGVLKSAVRRLGSRNVARRIEDHIPMIHNRLVSCVDIAAEREQKPLSPAFRQRLIEEATERVRAFDPMRVVDMPGIRRALLAAGGVLVVFVLAWLALSDRLTTAIARVFRPWDDIPPASGVLYTVEPGNATVLRGDEIAFAVHVQKGDPESLQLEISAEDGSTPLRYDLRRRQDNLWTFSLRGFETSFNYRVIGGGTWTLPFHITMVDRPKLVSLQATLHYPKYFGPTEPRPNPPQVADVSGPEQSEVEIAVGVAGDVARGEIRLFQSRPQQAPAVERPERTWFEERMPTGAKAKGTWRWDQKTQDRPTHTDPTAKGMHGHSFLGASMGFAVQAEESLFCYVYIPPDKPPKTIILKWHDGKRWGQRVFWGEDGSWAGKTPSAERHAMGPLPQAGQWVRLEIPASYVGLNGKPLRGMSFEAVGGQCLWNKAGALPSGSTTLSQLVQTDALPMQPAGKSTWSGRFPLLRDGFYRVHLENQLGAANLTMKEGKLTAIVDQPPQILLERPTGDLTLSAPQPVPMAASVYDDFALDEVRIAVRKGNSGEPRITTLKKYSGLVRSDTAVLSVDLAPYELKPGEHVRYYLEARDRKGQTARTVERQIRIAADHNAADQQLDRFEKKQDSFLEKLLKLIAQQEKHSRETGQLAAKYAPLEEKIRAAKSAEPPAGESPSPQAKRPEMDPETRKQLEQLRQELAGVAAAAEQNSALGQQLAAELARLVEEAAKLQMMPPEILAEFRAAKAAFERRAAQPLQQLAAEMKQEAAAKQPDAPPLADWQQQGKRLGAELAALAERLKAMDQARRQAASGADEALAKLRKELLQQQAGEAIRELGPLRDAAAALQKMLQQLEQHQVAQIDHARTAHEAAMPELEQKHEALKQQAAAPLAQAGQLLQPDRPQAMKPQSESADAAHAEDGEQHPESPHEQDAPVPSDAKAAAKPEATAAAKSDAKAAEKSDATATEKSTQKPEEKEETRHFEPALGGPRPQLDPRLAEKRLPPKEPPAAPSPSSGEARREALNARQFQKLTELDTAQQSLGSDVQSLDKLLSQLQQGQGTPPPAASPQGSPAEQPPANPPQGSPAAQPPANPPQGSPAAQPPANPPQGSPAAQPPASPPQGSPAGQPQPAAAQSSPAGQPPSNPPQSSPAGQPPSAPPQGSPAAQPPANPPQGSPAGQPPSAPPQNASAEQPPSAPPQPSPAEQELSQLLQSPALERAMAMAQRLPAAREAGRDQQGQTPSSEAQRSGHGVHPALGLRSTRPDEQQIERQLRELDPATRTVLLKMQPHVREELLRGMREQGPEGYQQFIREYFQRLTEVHGPNDH